MTKTELLELLGDMDPQYILEGQRLRSGQSKTRNKHGWARRTVAAAAVLAVTLAAGVLLKPYFAASWVHPIENLGESTADTAGTTMGSGTTEAPLPEPLTEEFQGVLENTVSFYVVRAQQDMTLAEYTEYLRDELKSEDCQAVKYGVLDIDLDGEQELLIRFQYLGEDYETLVVDHYLGTLTGWEVQVRAMDKVKADGTAMSNGSWVRGYTFRRIRGATQNIDASALPKGEDYDSLPELSWVMMGEKQREPKKVISFYLDGEEVQREAALFQGEQFSMYVFPDWIHGMVAYGDTQADRFGWGELESGVNLTVIYRQEKDLSLVREWLRLRQFPVDLTDSASGSLRSSNCQVLFTEAPEGYLVQILQWNEDFMDPDSALRTMKAMAETLLPSQEAVKGVQERPDTVVYTLAGPELERRDVRFALFQGDGWSTYIPENAGWEQTAPSYLKLDTPRMEAVLCLENGSSRFTVIRMENATRDEAVNWIGEAYPAHGWDWDWDWDFSGLSCTGANETRTVKKRFVPYRDGYYAVISDCEIGLTERYLRIMDVEFRVTAPA